MAKAYAQIITQLNPAFNPKLRGQFQLPVCPQRDTLTTLG